jgi:hypothetical protein
MYDNPDDLRSIRLPVYVSKKERQLERLTAQRLGMQPAKMRRDILTECYRKVAAMTDAEIGRLLTADNSQFTGLLH